MQPANVARWFEVLRSAAPADQKKKAKAACSLRAFRLEQTDEWRRSPQGAEVQSTLESYEQSLRRPTSGRLIQLTEKAAAAAVATQANTEELLERARGKIPEKRPDQTPIERVRELDVALANVPALRAERQQMAMLGRQQAAEQRQAKHRRSGAVSAGSCAAAAQSDEAPAPESAATPKRKARASWEDPPKRKTREPIAAALAPVPKRRRRTPHLERKSVPEQSAEEQRVPTRRGDSRLCPQRRQPIEETTAAKAGALVVTAAPRAPGHPAAAERGARPQDLEPYEGRLFGHLFGHQALSAEAVRERLLHFPKEARLPLWRAAWGEDLLRLPEVPSNGQLLIYSPAERTHYYVGERAVQRSDKTDELATAFARIHYAALLTKDHPAEARAARARLLRDYHPDKAGNAQWATAIDYIKSSFAEEAEP